MIQEKWPGTCNPGNPEVPSKNGSEKTSLAAQVAAAVLWSIRLGC